MVVEERQCLHLAIETPCQLGEEVQEGPPFDRVREEATAIIATMDNVVREADQDLALSIGHAAVFGALLV